VTPRRLGGAGLTGALDSQSGVAVLVTVVAAVASTALAVSRGEIFHAVTTRPLTFASLVVLTIVLQLLAVEVYGKGSISISGLTLLAAAFNLGIGPGMAAAAIAAAVHGIHKRNPFHRAIFNTSTFVLATGAAGLVYRGLGAQDWSAPARLAAATTAGVVFWAVNIGLLTLAMSIAESRSPRAVWTERFKWLTLHYLCFGPLALASTVAAERLGSIGLLAFILPPAMMIITVRQYLVRTRASVEELREANDDLTVLLELAEGLASRARDREALLAYAESAIGQVVGAEVKVATQNDAGGEDVRAGERRVASVQLTPLEGFDPGRWDRLRDAIVPQLATALETADLIDEVTAQNLATKTALERSVLAEEALRESEERFRQLAETIPDVFFLVAAEPAEMLYVSPAYEQMWGRSLSSAYADPLAWTAAVHPDDRPRVLEELASAQRGTVELSFRILLPDGGTRWLTMSLSPVRDEAGTVIRHAAVASDVTARHKLENQLRQSQKMEAVGQLAGGVAHDFNNLLTAISGYASFALDRAGHADPKLRGNIEEIARASDRAAGLTKQLLAFSRRQMLQPTVVNLNDVVTDTDQLVRRLIGENIQVVLALDSRVGNVLADSGQVGQVVMNLAINARDAMPRGGVLTVSTRNAQLSIADAALLGAEPGQYVVLRVSDTGTGISEETRQHIFEPFFTTKEPGKGTGLGLSTVYGIVKQSGGYIRVASEPGEGAAFDIFLPRTAAAIARAEVVASVDVGPGEGSVLLVEDEEIVRALVAEMLELDGYRVSTASTPKEALETWAADGPFDALVADLVMPGMNGRELAAKIRGDRHDLRVLFISGYSRDAVQAKFGEDPGSLLQKPFTSLELRDAVRQLLAARPDAGDQSAAA
jgi:PAS domain S-box-containing protein